MALLSVLVSLTSEQRNKLGELANKFKPTHFPESSLSEDFHTVGDHGFSRAKKEPLTAVDRRIKKVARFFAAEKNQKHESNLRIIRQTEPVLQVRNSLDIRSVQIIRRHPTNMRLSSQVNNVWQDR